MGLMGRKKLLVNLSEFPSLELFNFISDCCSAVSVVPSAAKDKIQFASPKTQTGALDPGELKAPWTMGWWISSKNLQQTFCLSSGNYAELPQWTFTQHSCSFSTWWTAGTHFQPQFYITFNITVLTSHEMVGLARFIPCPKNPNRLKSLRPQEDRVLNFSLNVTTYFFLKFSDSC